MWQDTVHLLALVALPSTKVLRVQGPRAKIVEGGGREILSVHSRALLCPCPVAELPACLEQLGVSHQWKQHKAAMPSMGE